MIRWLRGRERAIPDDPSASTGLSAEIISVLGWLRTADMDSARLIQAVLEQQFPDLRKVPEPCSVCSQLGDRLLRMLEASETDSEDGDWA